MQVWQGLVRSRVYHHQPAAAASAQLVQELLEAGLPPKDHIPSRESYVSRPGTASLPAVAVATLPPAIAPPPIDSDATTGTTAILVPQDGAKEDVGPPVAGAEESHLDRPPSADMAARTLERPGTASSVLADALMAPTVAMGEDELGGEGCAE
jgi:hypothetical protein